MRALAPSLSRAAATPLHAGPKRSSSALCHSLSSRSCSTAATTTTTSGRGSSPPSRRPRVAVAAMLGGVLNDLFGGAGSAAAQPRRGCELAPKEAPEGLELATFAGGCFWGLELALQRVPGVVSTSVGYTGGADAAPTYESVCQGVTGHAEAVQVTYDPDQVTYRQLLDVFFDRVDPTTLNRQGNDRGSQYRSGVFTHTPAQRDEALAKVAELDEALSKGPLGGFKWAGRKVVTTVEPAADYYLAEPYHQQYLARGGRFGAPQSAAKGCTDKIRCYG